MKYRIISVCAMLLLIGGAMAIGSLDAEVGEPRVHQHLTSRGPDEGCDCDGSELCTHLPLVILDTG